MDSIDCGDGTDIVVVNRSDRVFNCERVIRAHGGDVPGRVWIGSNGDDHLERPGGSVPRLSSSGSSGDDMLNGQRGPDMLWGNDGSDDPPGDHGLDLLLGGPAATSS